jgi:hypothetical protein
MLCLLIASLAAAQVPSPSTSVCEIVAHPKRFAGRIVTVRAEVIVGLETFAIEDPSGKCDRMWLQYAGGSPTAMVSLPEQTPKAKKAKLELRRDVEFEQFDNLLNAEMHSRERGTLCMACKRYAVTATMTGRVDVAPEETGFGHLNAYAFQFDLQSVSDAVGKDLAGNYDSELFSATPVRFPTGYFSGIVRSPSGEPVKGIEVVATRTDEVPVYMRQVTKRTDENGGGSTRCASGHLHRGNQHQCSCTRQVSVPANVLPRHDRAHVSHGAHRTGLADHEDGFVDFNFRSSKGCSYPCAVGRWRTCGERLSLAERG